MAKKSKTSIEKEEISVQLLLLKNLVLDLTNDLIQNLEHTENQEAMVYISGTEQMTIRELTENIKNLTPVGINHIADWYKAKNMLMDNKHNKLSIDKVNDKIELVTMKHSSSIKIWIKKDKFNS